MWWPSSLYIQLSYPSCEPVRCGLLEEDPIESCTASQAIIVKEVPGLTFGASWPPMLTSVERRPVARQEATDQKGGQGPERRPQDMGL